MADEVQVALLAGAEEPIAHSIARELIRRDWSVLLAGGQEQALRAAAEQLAPLAAREGQLASYRAELTSPAEREQLVEFALDEFGRIDMLVVVPAGSEDRGAHPQARQGGTGAPDLLELSEEAYHQVLASYLTAPLFLSQLVANEMVRLAEAGEIEAAKIVLINSIGAYTTSTDRAAHCIARAGTGMVTRLLADRLSEHGINVYEVRAGLISSPAEEPRGPAGPAGIGQLVHARYDRLIEEGLTPIRRWGRPQDVALAVAAIAEDLLPYSTGEVINVDGGFHLRRL